MKNTLDFKTRYTICEHINENKDTFSRLSFAAAAKVIKDNLGHAVSAQQVRDLYEAVGIEKSSPEMDAYALTLALASRLSWPISTLLSEGRKILEEAELKRAADTTKGPELPINEDATA